MIEPRDATSDELSPGDPIGDRYVVERLLDRGGMGSVYAARDRDLDRPVALKILPSEEWTNPRSVERFMRQARALARVEHRAVLRVYDRGLHADRVPFVVTELLTGSNLQTQLRGPRLSPREAIELSLELCEAVQAVHGQGVLHRDLKPSNVFLADEGEHRQLKLLDFGIAKLDDAAPLTGTQDLLGTLAYMAPERLEPGENATVASDVYGIACIVYELLTGSAPFRARSRAELIAMIVHDAPVSLRKHGSPIPQALDALILRALSKSSADRPESARTFAAALRPFLSALEPYPAPAVEQRRLLGSGRYQLLEKLGEGSFGVVYAALDQQRRRRVALKRLRALHSDDLFRLKREFRVLADVDHPNLVRRFELVADGDDAFFTMELIDGISATDRLRARPERAPSLLHQLASGLEALHSRGLVHRDLKPSNVIVANDDRVVLLDFGLTVRADTRSQIAGTPSYMAPEALNGEIGPAADLYALGVILHQVLAEPAESAERADAAFPHEPALRSLCSALLARDPRRRPTAGEVLSQLEPLLRSPPLVTRKGAEDGSADESVFVGRNAELECLHQALARIAHGSVGCVLLRGISGIGKSALAARAQRDLGSRALWLSSLCRESETVPYPALDAAIDALADHLCALSRESCAALLPRHAFALSQLFPVLQRVGPLAAQRGNLPADPAQVRTLAYAALHRLLQSVSERRPIVLFIDDLHWVDRDSAALLAYLTARPDPPTLLLVGAVRSDLEQSPIYQKLLSELGVPTQVLTLGELDANESRDVIAQLLPDAPRQALDPLATRIIEYTAGHPYLLGWLARRARQAGDISTVSLAALVEGLRMNDERAQALLELICLCERPLPLDLLLHAAGGTDPEHARALRRARLARRLLVAGRDSLEPYHVRVREAVLHNLSEPTRTARHEALASALYGERDAWPEALVEHLAGCGEGVQAARVATRAAKQAKEQLAFDRAAALYAIAQRHGRGDRNQQIEWLVLRATALRHAARGVEAAEALHRASLLCPGERSTRLARQAGELLLSAGQIENGLALLLPLLELSGLAMPGDAAAAVARGLREFGLLVQRGLARVARAVAPDPIGRLRCELSLSLADGLALVDVRGIPFAFTALLQALELDDAELLHHAFASFVSLTAGLFPNPLIEPALEACRELTHELNTPYARALFCAAEGEAAHFSGRFLVAESSFEQAERILLESCIGTPRELAAVRNGAVLIEYAQKGDFASQLERTLAWQSSAEARRDTFHENVLRVAHSIVWVAQDDPRKARAELEKASQAFKSGSGAYEVGMLEFWDVIDRYEGRDDVHLRPLQGREDILRSPAAASPFLAGYVHLQRGWGAIRALSRGTHSPAERAMADEVIAALRALGPEVWLAIADALEANLMYLTGERERALALLQRAEGSFRRLHMRCLSACARLRRGELSGNEVGRRLVQEACSELTQLGVKRPERWTRAYFTLFDPEQISELTLSTRADA